MFELYLEFITGLSFGIEHIDSGGDEEFAYLILINLGLVRLMLFRKN